MVHTARVKSDHYGCIGWLQISQPFGWLFLEQAQQFQNALMRRQPDLLAEIHEHGLVARRAESHARSPCYCTKPMLAPGAPSGPSLIGPYSASNREMFSPNARQMRFAGHGR